MNPNHPTEHFEQVYPRYEFAPLVRIALLFARRIEEIIAWKVRRVSKGTDHRQVGPSRAHETR